MNKILFYTILTSIILSCGNKNKDDDIPVTPVNIYIDLNINTSAPLSVPGGFIYITGGNKGIIIFHNFDDNFLAIERTCSYHPYDACNLITMDNNGIILKCGKYTGNNFDVCCGSEFTVDGNPSKTPATRPLRLYTVTKNGNQLHVYN